MENAYRMPSSRQHHVSLEAFSSDASQLSTLASNTHLTDLVIRSLGGAKNHRFTNWISH
jgi:hypothetical protein